MTYFDIVQRIADRLNLTSTDAIARIGQEVNDRYRRVTSSIGLTSSRFTSVSVTVDPTEIGSTLPDLTIEDINKILKINLILGTGFNVLAEVTPTEISDRPVIDGNPTKYAVKNMGAQSVTITLNAFPSTDTFDLTVEGYQVITDLTDDDIPTFSEDFHDILIFGPMADELRKMEKYAEADKFEEQFEQRVSDLRMFIAKSQYLKIYQARLSQVRPWNRNRIAYSDWYF